MLTPAQHAERRTGIGGSDVGAILGLSPYKTALDVWLEKTGRKEPDDLSDNDAIHWGNVLEDTVAAEYARRTGEVVHRVNQMQRHKEHHFLTANLDRRVVGQRKVLECKTASAYVRGNWGPAGTDQVPDYYLTQCTHYMAVMDWDDADLAVLIGGNDFRIYHIPRSAALEELIINQLALFWHLVETDQQPEPSNLRDLETLYAIDDGSTIQADYAIVDQCRELSFINGQIKDLERQKTECETKIKLHMKGAQILVDDDSDKLASFKSHERQSFDSKRFAEDHPDLYEQYVRTTTVRPFRLKQV